MSLEFHDLEVGEITITTTLEGGAEIYDGSMFVATIRPYKVGHNVNGWTVSRRDHTTDGSSAMRPTLRDAIKYEIARWRGTLPRMIQVTVTPDQYGLILGALFNSADVHFNRAKRSRSEIVKGRENALGNADMQAWHACSTSSRSTGSY